MQITIDTKHDSKEEIRKAIKMLMSLVGSGNIYANDETAQNIFEKPQADISGMMELFDNTPKEEVQEKEKTPAMEFY